VTTKIVRGPVTDVGAAAFPDRRSRAALKTKGNDMEPFSFAEFMREGGWGMWPVLVLGLVAVAAAAGSCIRPQRLSLRFVGLVWLTLDVVIVHAVITDLAAVFRGVSEMSWPGNSEFVRMVFAGLKESSRPAALGGIFLTLVPLIAAIGVYRRSGADAATGEMTAE
jgi:hypothetical protein